MKHRLNWSSIIQRFQSLMMPVHSPFLRNGEGTNKGKVWKETFPTIFILASNRSFSEESGLSSSFCPPPTLGQDFRNWALSAAQSSSWDWCLSAESPDPRNYIIKSRGWLLPRAADRVFRVFRLRRVSQRWDSDRSRFRLSAAALVQCIGVHFV